MIFRLFHFKAYASNPLDYIKHIYHNLDFGILQRFPRLWLLMHIKDKNESKLKELRSEGNKPFGESLEGKDK